MLIRFCVIQHGANFLPGLEVNMAKERLVTWRAVDHTWKVPKGDTELPLEQMLYESEAGFLRSELKDQWLELFELISYNFP